MGERERPSTDACALIALTAAVYRRPECQSDHLQEQINTAQCVSHSRTHPKSDHTHISPPFLSIFSHSSVCVVKKGAGIETTLIQVRT